jgi:hypothetical protein
MRGERGSTSHAPAACGFASLLQSRPVLGFRRLRDDPIHVRRRRACEKRQWSKSREAGASMVRRARRVVGPLERLPTIRSWYLSSGETRHDACR